MSVKGAKGVTRYQINTMLLKPSWWITNSTLIGGFLGLSQEAQVLSKSKKKTLSQNEHIITVMSQVGQQCISWCYELSHLTHWGRDKIDAILETTFSNAISWMKMDEFRSIFHRSLFLKVQLSNIPELVQIMAWRRTGDKPLSEPMMTQFNDAYMRHSAAMG